MGSKNTSGVIRFKTPEYEHPLFFRDLIVMELRTYQGIAIDNVEGTDEIEIKGATEKEAKRIRIRIKDLGASVMRS
jgi:hypothetical protein